MSNVMQLSLNGDTFAGLKKDFDTILARTLGNMQMKGAEDATITVKMNISLDKRCVGGFGSMDTVTMPSFKHDISSVMQIKDKMTGQFSGEYAMIWDEDEKCYVLEYIKSEQASLFDNEEPVGRFSDIEDDGDYADVVDAIEGSEPLALPEAEDDELGDDLDEEEAPWDEEDNLDVEEESEFETVDDEDEDPEEE